MPEPFVWTEEYTLMIQRGLIYNAWLKGRVSPYADVAAEPRREGR